jgi:hypothetical protein
VYEIDEAILKKFADLFVNLIKDKIAANAYPYGNPTQRGMGDKIATGQLYDSIQSEVEYDTDGQAVVVLYYADYFDYVNRGRKTELKRVPITPLLGWIKARGLRWRNKKGQFIPRLSMAFAIRENIFKYGIRKTNIYGKATGTLLDLLDEPPPELQAGLNQMYAAIENDINVFFDRVVKIELESI